MVLPTRLTGARWLRHSDDPTARDAGLRCTRAICTGDGRPLSHSRPVRCLRCLLLVMYTHPFAKKALTLHLAHSEGHERYFGCNLMHRKVLASSHQHLMAEAPHRTGFEFYQKVIRRFFGPACLYGQVLKTRRNDRIIKVERRALHGAAWQFEDVAQ